MELVFDLALVAGLVFLLVRGGSLNLVIATEVVAATAAAVGSEAFVLMFRTNERVRLSQKELLKKSAIFNLYTFVGNLYDRLDIVLLSKFAGDYATGVYRAAYRVPSGQSNSCRMAFFIACYPRFPEMHEASRNYANSSTSLAVRPATPRKWPVRRRTLQMACPIPRFAVCLCSERSTLTTIAAPRSRKLCLRC